LLLFYDWKINYDVGTRSLGNSLTLFDKILFNLQAKQSPWIVMIIFGGSAVIAGLLNLLLPETLGKHLPETLVQARNLGRGDTVQAFLPFDDDEGRPLLHSEES
jgi:hypothetical protein